MLFTLSDFLAVVSVRRHEYTFRFKLFSPCAISVFFLSFSIFIFILRD